MLGTRMKQWDERRAARVECRQIGPFGVIAQGTRQGEIIAGGLPTVFQGNDVIDMQRFRAVILMDETIHTAALSTFHDEAA